MLMQNNEFELPNGSNSLSDIPDYLEYIIKNVKQELKILQKNCLNRIEFSATFEIKTGCYL